MPDAGYYNMSRYFSATVFLFGIGVFACMLAYTILNLPKNLMSIAIGVSQFMAGLGSFLSIFLAIINKEKAMPSLPFRKTKALDSRFLMLLHLSVGTLMISDPVFLMEKTPDSKSGPIGSVLFQLMIAGAAAQAAGMLAMMLNNFGSD